MTFLFSKISKVKYLSLLTGILAFPIAANAQVCGVLKSEALGMGGAKYEYTIILQSPPAGMTGDFVQTVQFSMDSIKVETKGLVPKARQLKGNRIMDPRGKINLQGQIIYDKSKNIPTLSESVPSMGVVFPEVNAEPEFVTLMATKFRDSNLKVIKNAHSARS